MNPPEMAGWNLALRFILEVAALVGIGVAAWRLTGGGLRWAAVIGAPTAAIVAWVVFNVPDDPSRSGEAPVVVPGAARLGLELIVLGAGAAGFLLAGPRLVGVALLGLVVLHYALSGPRVDWLLAN